MNRLFLIDGHALIFKMYYAFMRRPMINSKGEDTSILYGFTKYLLELIRREQPTHMAVAFDPPAKTFRHELSPEYKANRSAAPEQVKAALDPLVEIVGALGIPVVMKPGFEADDVIGTLAKRESARGFDVYMVTPDKDLGQIIGDHIWQYKPGKAGGDDEIIGRDEICAALGITDPLQIIDILTIWGDASDNIKGVGGVGEVGARKLVGRYGSLEGIMEHLDDLPPKQQAAFREAAPHLPLSKTLATIRTDVELEIDEKDLELTAACNQCVSDLFDRYEFNSLRKLLPEGEEGEAIGPRSRKALEATEVSAGELVREIRSRGSFAFAAREKAVLTCGARWAEFDLGDGALRELFADGGIVKTGHGLKPDIEKLLEAGIAVNGEIHDIELMHYLLNPEMTHKLEILANGYLDADLSAEQAAAQAPVQPVVEFDLFSAPLQAEALPRVDMSRTARECIAAEAIGEMIRAELESQNLWNLYLKVEMPLIGVLARMELTGVKVDPSQLSAYAAQLSSELSRIESEARELSGEPAVNLSSPRQVGIVIYEKLNLNPRVKKTRQGSYPTDEETLSELKGKHPFIDCLLEYRACKKLLSTYLEPLPALINPRTGKIHTTFNQALTATGRLSSVKPNLQNIPVRSQRGREIRKAFVPSTPDGYIVSADYSQIELRLMAELSRDPALVEGFLGGADIHADTASRIFHVPLEQVSKEERRRAKVANFGIIYGISPFGLAQRMEIPRQEAKEFIEEYFRHYPKVHEYMDKVIADAREKGYVETLFGRKRYLPDINSRNFTVRSLAERNAINAPIQGSAADIIKLAMIGVGRRIEEEGLESRMVLQVHDELVFDVPCGELDRIIEMVKYEMENVCSLSVPLTVECNYGKNWLEAH